MRDLRGKSESGFVPLLVLGVIFMAGAVIFLALSSVKVNLSSLSLPNLHSILSSSSPKTTLNLPQNFSATTSSQFKAQNRSSSSATTFELPHSSNLDKKLASPFPSPSVVSQSFSPPPVQETVPAIQNQTNNSFNLNYLSSGEIDIEYNPPERVEVLIYPLDNYASTIIRDGNVNFESIPPGKYLLHFSNPNSLGVLLPNDSSIEIDPNKSTLIKVNLLNGQLTTTFGWAP